MIPLQLNATDKEFDCLAKNIYYEARGESLQGKIAVGLVTLNRRDHKNYPKSICGVVYQKNQFSWTKHYKGVKLNKEQWRQAQEAATFSLVYRDLSFTATHFHNKTVKPKWQLTRVAKIGGHVFYK